MKNKEKICHDCGSKMKYKGNRIFVCKKCGKRVEYLREVTVKEEQK
jgi:tRNA(Ile2) C34 agmatinyltransferase TiaS